MERAQWRRHPWSMCYYFVFPFKHPVYELPIGSLEVRSQYSIAVVNSQYLYIETPVVYNELHTGFPPYLIPIFPNSTHVWVRACTVS